MVFGGGVSVATIVVGTTVGIVVGTTVGMAVAVALDLAIGVVVGALFMCARLMSKSAMTLQTIAVLSRMKSGRRRGSSSLIGTRADFGGGTAESLIAEP